MLIKRYLVREIMLTMIATLLVLLTISYSQRLIIYLNRALSGALTQDSIFTLLALSMVKFISDLLPLTFLVSALLAFGRLYQDSEINAMFALGISVKNLYQALFLIAIPLSVILVILNFYIVPHVLKIQYEVQNKARTEAQFNVFKPSVFREIMGGKHVIYISQLNSEKEELNDIFVYSTFENQANTITLAKRGKQFIDPKTNIRFLDLFEGIRYEIVSSESGALNNDMIENIIKFESIRIKLDIVKPVENLRDESLPTLTLLKNSTKSASAELQRRLAGPISMLILVLLIPAIAHSKPRENRFNRLTIGAIVYLLYNNLLGINESWLRKGTIPSVIGSWWVHLSVLGCYFVFQYLQKKKYKN